MDNRESIKSLPLIWQNLMRQQGLALECVLPAVVSNYDRAKNLVTVRPAVNRVLAINSESVARAEIIVPCFNPSGNGIGINFPLKSGDTGWVIAADRDTTGFKKSRRVSTPQSYDLHRFAFGFFIPDRISGFEVAEEDSDALVIQSLDGNTKIAVGNNDIRINATDGDDNSTIIQVTKSGVEINTTGDTKVTAESATVTLLTAASITAPVISVTGDIELTGDMIATGDVRASNGQISLATHKHLDPNEEYTMTGKPTT